MIKKGTKLYTVFDEYTCIEQIGQGGNGTVFKVENSSGQTLALKAIDRNSTTSEKLKRFKNEMHFCYTSSHENIIKVIDWGVEKSESKDLIFYIMPFYSKTLRSAMDKGLMPNEILDIFSDILSGIAFAHSSGIFHRDIKPENILLKENPRKAILADFGIAHFTKQQKITTIETRPSERMANFKYAAPEQRGEGVVNEKADIYALGLLLNEMYTRNVISGTNFIKIGAVDKSFSFLDSIVEQMICQQPSDRIYPPEKIAKAILVAQSAGQESAKLQEILLKPNGDNNEFHEIPVPTVTGFDYKSGKLIVFISNIDYKYSQSWFSVLQQGMYGHSSLFGYDPNQLQFSNDKIALDISDNNSEIIKQMAGHIKSWLKPATELFNSKRLSEYQHKISMEKQRQEAEIKKLRAEEKAREELRSLIL